MLRVIVHCLLGAACGSDSQSQTELSADISAGNDKTSVMTTRSAHTKVSFYFMFFLFSFLAIIQ